MCYNNMSRIKRREPYRWEQKTVEGFTKLSASTARYAWGRLINHGYETDSLSDWVESELLVSFYRTRLLGHNTVCSSRPCVREGRDGELVY